MGLILLVILLVWGVSNVSVLLRYFENLCNLFFVVELFDEFFVVEVVVVIGCLFVVFDCLFFGIGVGILLLVVGVVVGCCFGFGG